MLQSMGLQRVRQDLATEQQQIRCLFGLPWWLSSKESACNEGAAGDGVQSLGWEDPLEEDMATNSSILAWRISWPWRATIRRVAKNWTRLKWLSTAQHMSCLFTLFHTGTYISTDTELAADSEWYSVNTVKLVVFGRVTFVYFLPGSAIFPYPLWKSVF